MWWQVAVGLAAGLVLLWLCLVLALWVVKPDAARLQESLRLLPDIVRLLSRLSRDKTLPPGLRLRLWLMLGYLAVPFDLIPDFVPVIGYADDAVLVAVVLRSVVRSAGRAGLERHWPGSPAGLAAVERLAGLSTREA
jgi:uncharacterized membrane protein YkvA (DUF1232 family)